jgi:hypothetical protein
VWATCRRRSRTVRSTGSVVPWKTGLGQSTASQRAAGAAGPPPATLQSTALTALFCPPCTRPSCAWRSFGTHCASRRRRRASRRLAQRETPGDLRPDVFVLRPVRRRQFPGRGPYSLFAPAVNGTPCGRPPQTAVGRCRAARLLVGQAAAGSSPS